MNTTRRVAACTLLALAQQTAFGQDGPACPPIPFQRPVPALVPLAIEQIDGQVVTSPAEAPKMVVGVNGICLALFTDGGTQVAVGSVNDRGQFRLADPRPGSYVLIGLGPPVSFVVPLNVSAASDGSHRGLLVRVTVDGSTRPNRAEPIGNLLLRQELFAMERVDQDVRKEAIAQGMTHIAPELERRMADIDSRNDVRLRGIVRQFGWPARDLVGSDGSDAAMTLVMHTPPSTQKAMLPLVEAAYRAGTVSGGEYANLLDHVLINDGKPQVYGTVAEPFKPDGEIVLKPIEDEAHVDARRADVGLMPLADYREFMKRLYFPAK